MASLPQDRWCGLEEKEEEVLSERLATKETRVEKTRNRMFSLTNLGGF